MEALYYVQAFKHGTHGPVLENVLVCHKEAGALWAADLLARHYDGVLAWRQLRDCDGGEGLCGDPQMIDSRGDLAEPCRKLVESRRNGLYATDLDWHDLI